MSYTKPGEVLQRYSNERAEIRARIADLEKRAREESDNSDFFFAGSLRRAEELRKQARELRNYLD